MEKGGAEGGGGGLAQPSLYNFINLFALLHISCGLQELRQIRTNAQGDAAEGIPLSLFLSSSLFYSKKVVL